MIVSAPDGKVIDFGDMPPDQVGSVMQKHYPPTQAADKPQDSILPNNPQHEYGAILPIGLNKTTGNNFLTAPQFVRDMVHSAEMPGKLMSGQVQAGSPEALASGRDLAMIIAGSPAAKGIAKPAEEAVAKGMGNITKGLAETAGEIKSGINATQLSKLEEIAGGMKSQAKNTLQKAFGDNPILSKPAAENISQYVNNAVAQTGRLNKRLHGDTISVLNDLEKDAKKGMTLEQLEQYRQILRQVVKKNTTKLEGAGVEVPKSQAAIDAIDQQLTNITPESFVGGSKLSGVEAVKNLEAYRKQYAAYKRFERISDMANNAKGDASKIQAAFEKMAKKERNMAGHPETEKAVIKKIAKSGLGDKTLAGLGKAGFNPAKQAAGGLVPVAETLGALSHPALAAPVFGGTLANLFRNAQRTGQVDQLLNMIRNANVQK